MSMYNHAFSPLARQGYGDASARLIRERHCSWATSHAFNFSQKLPFLRSFALVSLALSVPSVKAMI